MVAPNVARVEIRGCVAEVCSVRVRDLPRAFQRELKTYFLPPGEENAWVVSIVFKCGADLSSYGDKQFEEKNYFLELFFDVCSKFEIPNDKFLHIVDPASGCVQNSNAVWVEVDFLTRIRKFSSLMAGSCKIASHPLWGTSFYPCTLFTNVEFEPTAWFTAGSA